MNQKHIRLLALVLTFALLLPVLPFAYAEESGEATDATTEPTETTTVVTEEATIVPDTQSTPTNDDPVVDVDENNTVGGNADGDFPSVVDIGENVYNILIPVSGYATYGRKYAVALSKIDGFDDASTNQSIAKVWQDTEGTNQWTYIVGESVGTTTFQLGGHTYTVRVVPRQEDNASVKHIKISAQNYDPDKVTMYYSINGSELYKADPSKVDIDQDFPGGFNITIFAAPKEGYALTRLRADTGEGLFYSLSGEKEDGTDSMAWPFEDPDADDLSYTKKRDPFKGNAYQHSFGGFLDEKNMTVNDLRDLYKRAKARGCEGVLTYTKNSTSGLEANISCEIVPLPTMTKTIVGYRPKGKTAATDAWISTIPDQLEIGDQLKYAFTITGSGSEDIEFSNIVLKDELIGFSNDKYTSANLQNKDGFVAYAEYTIKAEDISKYTGGKFTNSATLQYTYASKYSKGTKNVSKSSSVSCNIKNLITFDWCDHTPDAIKNDKVNFPLPSGFEVQVGTKFTLPTPTTTKYDVIENGYVVGTWNFKGYGYLRTNNTYENFEAGDELEITNADMNAVFYGHWEYEEAPKYSVTLEWTGLPEGSNEKVPTHDTQYYAGQSFNVDSFYQKGMIIDIDGTEYIFAGWKLAETDSTTISGLQKMEAGGITLYGEWNPLGKQTTLTISVSGCNDLDENQTYLFRVTGDDVDLTVSVHGNSSVTIYGVLSNQTYTVTPVSGWSWRYKALEAQPVTIGDEGSTVTFAQERTTSKLLDGNAFSNLFNNRKEDD